MSLEPPFTWQIHKTRFLLGKRSQLTEAGIEGAKSEQTTKQKRWIYVSAQRSLRRATVNSIAEISAFALLSVSSYSAVGSLSATTPQPA